MMSESIMSWHSVRHRRQRLASPHANGTSFSPHFQLRRGARSYDQLPARSFCDLVLQTRARGPLKTDEAKVQRTSLENEVASPSRVQIR